MTQRGSCAGFAYCGAQIQSATRLLVNWLFWPRSVAIYQDWIAAGRPAELRVYSKGGHGFGMRQQHLAFDHWIGRFADWLDAQGLLKK